MVGLQTLLEPNNNCAASAPPQIDKRLTNSRGHTGFDALSLRQLTLQAISRNHIAQFPNRWRIARK